MSRPPSSDTVSSDIVCATALAGLPGIGPATLTRLLDGATPTSVWQAVVAGDVTRPLRRGRPGPDPLVPLRWDGGEAASAAPAAPTWPAAASSGPAAATWQAVARRCDLEEVAGRLGAGRIGVTWRTEPQYPRALAGDPEPPGVLFWRGDLAALDRSCAAIVGTRRCSPDGRRVAYELGRDLADSGVCVVSGLALGIDGGAHQGALATEDGVTAGVAASGVDVAYPRRHAGLWEEVVGRGVVLSENAPGRPAQGWRFPSRNRVIAALVGVLVVVESHESGGALLTVDAALARGVDVGAVPGPVHSPASAGTNRLLCDGATPVRHAGDVLDSLGLAGAGVVAGGSTDVRARREREAIAGLSRSDRRTYEAVGWAPTGLGRIVEHTGFDVGVAGRSLAHLEHRGLVEGRGDWWVRRCPDKASGRRTTFRPGSSSTDSRRPRAPG